MKTPPKDSVIINICIIPPFDIGETCVNLSQSLKSDSTMFVLDGKSKFAHMTVYMARFANSEIPKVLFNTREVLENLNNFLCEHTGYFMTEGRYFEISYQKSKSLVNLQESLIKNLKSYRINPSNPFKEGYFTPYTEEQQKNAKETGYDLAFNLYRPHITLTRYKIGQVPKNLPKLKPIELSFKPYSICVYKADDNGAIYEKLDEFIINEPAK
ncbi:MAG: hypothetical protein A2904_01170 [Candidatus Staskawiczbacteria bacterium RIFCSPLOWO2_01_FULL_33_9]|uniref:2'-5' RNA ligase n=1 Tax=Candidatus Staskawiczbacteria bacterium RIFCSPLOWO2_01_FULL_33_9 TaxID=1802211 RepID=A0A1G2I6E6_9BACT|nr:MAG: hypothetical protein A2904_01170 [Candidatus Staskawiczbacteria bacterium RIFCSPLOWO2_01_FULL_33_9]